MSNYDTLLDEIIKNPDDYEKLSHAIQQHKDQRGIKMLPELCHNEKCQYSPRWHIERNDTELSVCTVHIVWALKWFGVDKDRPTERTCKKLGIEVGTLTVEIRAHSGWIKEENYGRH